MTWYIIVCHTQGYAKDIHDIHEYIHEYTGDTN